MATPTKEELADAVNAIEVKAGKLEKGIEKWRKLHGGAKGAVTMAARVAPFTPVAGMVVTYFTGLADAMTRTEDVKNPVTIATGLLSWVGSGICAWKGWALPAIGLGSAATASLGALTHDVGVAKGEAMKAAG